MSAFLPGMLERNAGVIITMASSAARQAAKSSAAYAAAKAGVIALTRHLASEFGGSGIRVNCIAPSAVENDRMRSWVSEEQRIAFGASFPLGRIGQPEGRVSDPLPCIRRIIVDHRRYSRRCRREDHAMSAIIPAPNQRTGIARLRANSLAAMVMLVIEFSVSL